MNLIEETIESMRQLAEMNSSGEGIDEHWEAVLPEMYDIMANEIFLTLHRHNIDESMKRWAAQVAQNLQPSDVSEIDVAKLFLHCLVRGTLLGIADNPEFQNSVDGGVSGVIHPAQGSILNPMGIGWARSARLWLPLSEEVFVRIAGALVERFKQSFFAEHCRHELTRRLKGKKINKDMFALLTDSDVITQSDREEAYQRISNVSEMATKGLQGIDFRDPMHDWWTKLATLPRHTQLLKLGATPDAIRQRAIDIQRKGGKSKLVSLDADEELTNTIPDESLEPNDNGIIRDELRQLLSANQQKIEEILSLESPKKRQSEIGKRRFKVMQMLEHERDLTSTEIANQLNVGNQTIGRDRDVIRRCKARIREVIYS